MTEVISLFASLATLILFVIYFIGRIWSLKISKKQIYENVNFTSDKRIVSEWRAEDYYLEMPNERLFVSGNESVLDITILQPVRAVKLCMTDSNDFDELKVKPDKILKSYESVSAGEHLYWICDIPEGFSRYWIDIERFDYSVARVFVTYGGYSDSKVSVINCETPKKTTLFYLVR